VREQREAFEVRVVLIEDKASGTRMIQELVADGLRAVTRSRTKSCACRPEEGSARPGRPRAPNRLLWSSRYYQKAIFHGEKCGRYSGAKGHQLDFVPSRCLSTRRVSARVLVTPQAEPKVWNQRNDPFSIVAADIGLPELSSIVICSSVPT
jgi:hypothetical protein